MSAVEEIYVEPTVKIIDPYALPSTMTDPLHCSGQVVHKAVLSHANDGASGIEASYNRYSSGVSFHGLKQTREGLCYIIAGEGEMEIGDKKLRVLPGQFVFQPIGSIVGLTCITDIECLCVFVRAAAGNELP